MVARYDIFSSDRNGYFTANVQISVEAHSFLRTQNVKAQSLDWGTI